MTGNEACALLLHSIVNQLTVLNEVGQTPDANTRDATFDPTPGGKKKIFKKQINV